MRKSPQIEEIEKKVKEENEIDSKNIKNQIMALLKCDICNTNFDLNIHIPMVAKCGHTFCKKCIYNGGVRSSYGICPIDNIHHVLGIESCIPNLKLELIIKKIFNYTEPKITEKKIICFNNEIRLNNNLKEKLFNDKVFRSSSGNKNFFCTTEDIFPKVLTDIKNKTITNFKINKDKEKENINLNNNDNVDVIEELNVINDINFTEENKINDESIDTIPLNDDKSNANISFKDEFDELLNKNEENQKKEENINDERDKDNNKDKEDKIKKNKKDDNNNKSDKKSDGKEIGKNSENKQKDEIEDDENDKHIHSNKEESSVENIKNVDKNEVINEKEDNKNNPNNSEKKEDNNINKNNNEKRNLIIHNNKIIYFTDLQRNSINYFRNDKKDEIEGIDETVEYIQRPKTITVAKNIKIEQKFFEKNKDNKKSENPNPKENKEDEKEIEKENDKFNIYDKASLKKRKTISQENNVRNRIKIKNKIRINIKNKSEEKANITINIRDKKNDDKSNDIDNNKFEPSAEEDKKKPTTIKYKILSKKIGLKKHPECVFNHSNSNSISNSPTNLNNSDETLDKSEKFRFCKPSMKNSALNNYCVANKLLSNIVKNENKNIFVVHDISPFHKKKYIGNKLRYINCNSSNSYHKINETYNKKKLKGKSNLFLTVKNNYNISLNNSNNNLNSTSNKNQNIGHINNMKQLMTLNNINKHDSNNMNNNNKAKNNKISLSMSPGNKENIGNADYKFSQIFSETDNKNSYYKNDIHSTRDLSNINNNFCINSKEINRYIKTITIRRINSSATSQNLAERSKKSVEKNKENDSEDINEIKNNLRFEFNRVFNYQIDLYENLKDSKNKNILLSKSKKYKSLLEEFLVDKNSNEELKNIKICFLPEGELFIGQKELNLPIYGITYNLNGDYYKGEFVNGKKEGNGVMIYKNGTKYEGAFKNNKHEGFGKLIQLDGETFTGEWKDGKINGNGIRCHCNGDKYIGNYVNNIRNGHGNYTFSNGDSYEGNWVNGKATGKGVFRFKNGDMYEGEFKENIIMGAGNFKTKNGNVYLGTFKNGLINGKGVLIFHNGEKYVGFFQNGKKSGIGKMYDKNGKVYKTGFWKNDKYIGNKYI